MRHSRLRACKTGRQKFSAFFSRSDTFLSSPCAENATKKLASTLRSEFITALRIQRPTGNWDHYTKHTGTPIENITVTNVEPYRICFEIPLRDFIGINHTAVTVGFMPYTHSVTAEKLWIVFPSTDFWFEQTPSKDVFSVDIRISNGGVYDRSEFPPCTKEFSSKKECEMQKRLEDVVETCKCIPFAYRSKFTEQKWRNMPFCTLTNYTKCKGPADPDCEYASKGQFFWRFAKTTVAPAAATKSKFCDSVIARPFTIQNELCVPCQYAKNNYFLTTRYRGDVWRYFQKQSVEITFECKDQFYAFFKEIKQFEIFQLIGLIGGNLGLYIGFSLIGVASYFLSPSDQNGYEPVATEEKQRNTRFWTGYIVNRMKSLVLIGTDEKTEDDDELVTVRRKLDVMRQELKAMRRELNAK